MWLLLACAGGGVTLDDASTDDTNVEDTDVGGEHLIQLSINELMADNATSLVLDDGTAPDWIELYNASEYDIDLTGFSITDDLAEPMKHVLSDVVVESEDFVVLYADGGDSSGGLGFKLGAGGESIGLYTPDSQPIDLIEFGEQVQDMALARVEDGVEGDWHYVYGGTPGDSNED